MINLRTKFTKWYYRKGYTMEWKTCDYGDGVAETIFHCPLWVRPLVSFFFSPSVYYVELIEDLENEIENLEWDFNELKGEE